VKPILEVRNLTKRYGQGCPQCLELTGPGQETNQCPRCRSVLACREVSFSLCPGEVLGIVGESGSGKSTVVRLLHFDFEPTAGEFLLCLNGHAPEGLEAGARKAAQSGQNLFGLSAFHRRQLRNELMGIVYQNARMGLRLKVSAGGNISERLLMSGWRHVGRMRERAGGLLVKT
jgi:putative phosphonate transport system ATP-binding protein